MACMYGLHLEVKESKCKAFLGFAAAAENILERSCGCRIGVTLA